MNAFDFRKFWFDLSKEKREALQLWADRLEAIVAGDVAKVIPMHAIAER